MTARARRAAPDEAQRRAAITERARNVLVDAGAGTGKTTILVDRLVEMLAPASGGPAIPIGRIAAITFTRKAAGELRLRIRERLLEALASVPSGSPRDGRLRDALAGLDTAHVGTIHGFADRLLRLKPVEAGLSPSHEIAEDEGDQGALVGETVEVLLQAVESGTLAAELAGTGAAGRAEEATRTILDALEADLKAESRETEWKIYYGLDALVGGFIRQRDVPPPDAEPAGFDAEGFRAAADAFVRAATPVRVGSPGADWILRTAEVLSQLRERDDAVGVFRELRRQLGQAPREVTKKHTFGGDDEAWKVWKAFKEGKEPVRPLADALRAPLDRWMATRLARIFPVVIALYEWVKARRRQLDQLDLLVKLRDLLRDDLASRGEYQKMFDHVFVDEFQDTDPLQAEIVLFLCEREPVARRWEDIALAEGKLTLVGDPKQSIYRFRRADVLMYDRVRALVARGPHLEATLSASFRGVPPLIAWCNDRFARVLGVSPDRRRFDPVTGTVFQQPLEPGREGDPSPAVHVLPFEFGDGARHLVDDYRQLEGRVLARYLRWLVELSGTRIVDPLDGRPRAVRYGDIAVLAVSTWGLGLLFPRLDAEGIPYASRGGTLFLEDPFHRQFLLGLRAIADRDDGVAEAALFRPPFFAVDPLDLLRERAAAGGAAHDEAILRVRAARELVGQLRTDRAGRPVGATARDLLEGTAFARAIARGPNGAQRLARLRELCLVLEQLAAREGLDYDAATARLREWVERPVQLDPPHPVGAEAVQVLTVHQAKGLEFPVVALWDGKGLWDPRPQGGPWRMEREGGGWALDLDGLGWEEPEALGIGETDRKYLAAERRRVVYVAATRARDILILPKAGVVAPGRYVLGDLLADAPPHLVRGVDEYVDGNEPEWAGQDPAEVERDRPDVARVEHDVDEWWRQAAAESARRRFQPASVTGEAHAASNVGDAADASPKRREGRFGDAFGSAVHAAIGLVLKRDVAAEEAVRRAARRIGLDDHLAEAVADVERAVAALSAEGLVRQPAVDLRLEYPIAEAHEGRLLVGHVDLVAAGDNRIDVIDFKTDVPPDGPVERAYPEYVVQLRTYGRMVEAAGIAGGRRLRCGLLFTADGAMRWVDA